jgi:ankyrin repeat protein
MKYIRNIIILITIVLLINSCASTEVRAVRQGDLQKLEKFLSKGGNPNEVDKEGNGLIHVAVQYGQADSLQTLLLAGANPNLLNRTGNTALILAVEKNAINMTDILTSYGGDVSIAGSNGRTTLMLAAANGSVQMMEKLLSEGIAIEAVDNSGLSALFYSVSGNNPEGLSFLIRFGADAGRIDNKDRNPLHLLTQNGQKSFISLLVEAGADPSRQQSSTGETPLHIASGAGAWELVSEYLNYNDVLEQVNLPSTGLGTPLFYALKPELSSQAAINTIRILLDADADPNLVSVDGIVPIVHAVEKLDATRVELLVKYGSKLNFRSADRKTLLHLAAARSNPSIVSILLESGVDPDLTDLQGDTALLMTVMGSDIESTELLLISGADTDIINNDGDTPLKISLERDADRNSGISKETSLLLEYKASLPPGKEVLSQILHRVVDSGNADVAEILLRYGANPNERVQEGKTLLMLSSSSKYVKLSDVLLRKGARTNMWDKNGNTAMHYASTAGSVDGVKLLLRFGENPDSENYETFRPIQLAPQNEQGKSIIGILLAAGAQPVPQKAEPETVVPADEASEAVDKETGIEIEDGNQIALESETETLENNDPADKDTVTEKTVTEESLEEVKENQAEEIKGEPEKNVEWVKAKILSIGETEPRKVSGDRISFENFLALVPKSYPKNLYSKSNNREVTIYILNETEITAEIYFVNTVGIIEAIQKLSPWESTSIDTREGNIYPVYTQNNKYFGEIKSTGREEQYFRLTDNE